MTSTSRKPDHEPPSKFSLRVCGVILLVVVFGMNVGERSSIRNVLNAESTKARHEALAQAGVDIVIVVAGVSLIAMDFIRRGRRNRQ